MSVKLKIKVTKEITEKAMYCGTDRGEGSITSSCQVALAIREIFPNADVNYNTIMPFYYPYDSMFPAINLPIDVISAIRKFDRSSPQERLELPEYEFEIDIPDEVIEKIDIENISEILKESKTLELL